MHNMTSTDAKETTDSPTHKIDQESSVNKSEDRLSSDEETPMEENEEAEGEGGKSGWADAMSKILGKPNGTKILSKARELKKVKVIEDEEKMEEVKRRKQKRDWREMSRAKPQVTEREYEKALQRTATRGVVQLFNAVKKQQKTLDSKLKEVGPSERKQAKVMQTMTKGDFVDLLKGTKANVLNKPRTDVMKKRKGSVGEGDKSAEDREHGASWNILREDFMMGAKMKDWDQGSESDEDRKGDHDDDDSDT
ncbi:RRP15-like protein isoform X2 [Ptychodera flava]|uniref:RRP15-like protein isoform X2 n=1 Tax=Ptychodera flava TaxID=63121 RepID=UPI00396A47B0